MATTGTIVHGFPDNTNILIKKILYTYVWPSDFSIAANGSKEVTANSFDISTPEGYDPVGVGRYNSGSSTVHIYKIDIDAVGEDAIVKMRNVTSSAQKNLTSYIEIIYIKNGFTGWYDGLSPVNNTSNQYPKIQFSPLD